MSNYSPKPNPEQYKDRRDDYLRDKREWDKQERQADLERVQAAREIAASPWFQKSSLFLGHIVFFGMLSVAIFSKEHRSDTFKAIADPNPLWSIAKAIGYIALLYITIILISPMLLYFVLAGMMVAVIMFFLGMF
jgi:hypothetical protein